MTTPLTREAALARRKRMVAMLEQERLTFAEIGRREGVSARRAWQIIREVSNVPAGGRGRRKGMKMPPRSNEPAAARGARIIALRNQGVPLSEIVEQEGITASHINNLIRAASDTAYRRDCEWSQERKDRLRQMWADGWTVRAMMIELGVSKTPVLKMARKMGLPRRRAPDRTLLIRTGIHIPRNTNDRVTTPP